LIVGAQLNTAVFHYQKNATQIRSGSADGIIQNLIFDSSTGYLPKLHSHMTNLQSGAGYPPHADAHDVATLLLEGTVETLGQRVESQGLIFYTAGEPHGMKNVGNTMASYLVFEFHGNADRLIDSLLNENKILADELKVAVTELELLKAGMRNSLALQFARKIPYGNQLRNFLKRAFR